LLSSAIVCKLLFISFTFRTKLHRRIAIIVHHYFSLVSYFASNYIIALPSLLIVSKQMSTLRVKGKRTFRTKLHRRIAIIVHHYFSLVSYFASNYIIALPSLLIVS
jgi:hypothetical protein